MQQYSKEVYNYPLVTPALPLPGPKKGVFYSKRFASENDTSRQEGYLLPKEVRASENDTTSQEVVFYPKRSARQRTTPRPKKGVFYPKRSARQKMTLTAEKGVFYPKRSARQETTPPQHRVPPVLVKLSAPRRGDNKFEAVCAGPPRKNTETCQYRSNATLMIFFLPRKKI